MATQRQIVFDLTNVDNLKGVLDGSFKADATTSLELRYLRDNWDRFGNGAVEFLNNGTVVKAPWLQ